jgi:hypothetical protein
MSAIDFLRGALTIFFVMVFAGGVAYVGDRVGHQVGRKRLTLFGIRPRYTSTIVAVGTGMVIALVVTLGAIFASNQVKTAFFQLSSINAQITQLQAREADLEQKVSNGQLVVPYDTLMVPFYRIIPQSASSAQRLASIKQYYTSAVQYVNSTYLRLDLKPYKPPSNYEKLLSDLSNASLMQAQLSQGNVLLTVSSSQNLFVGDEIHFAMNATPDTRRFIKGQPIATLTIPGNGSASANIALSEVQTAVTARAKSREVLMPSYLASNVQALQIIPDISQMQAMMAKRGTYLMTAYAAEDVYPHTGGIPIIIVLTQAK